MPPRLAILADYSPSNETHIATDAAVEHSAAALGATIDHFWINTRDATADRIADLDGMWIGPASPYEHMDNVLRAIQFARETGLPCLGTCGGFQHLVLEYARNVLGIRDAAHAEIEPGAARVFLSRLACSLVGREMLVTLKAGSQAAASYGRSTSRERYYCNFGVNPEFVPTLAASPLQITGSDAEGEVRIVELPGHPFYLGTLFIPQASSTPTHPHPLVTAFLQATQSHATRATNNA